MIGGRLHGICRMMMARCKCPAQDTFPFRFVPDLADPLFLFCAFGVTHEIVRLAKLINGLRQYENQYTNLIELYPMINRFIRGDFEIT